MATAEKLNYLLETKNQIKNAITEKGVSISDTDSFRSYASKIKQIEGSGGSEDTFLNLRTNGGITGSALFAYAPKEICNESLTNFIKKIDTSNMEDFSYMFYYSKFKELHFDEWNMSNARDMSYMFTSSILKEIDLSNCNLKNVSNMSFAFYSSLSLLEVNLTNCDTSNVTSINNIFNNCMVLATVKGILDFINVTSLSGAFGSMSGNAPKLLEEIRIKNVNTSGLNLSYCEKLSYDSLIYLINNLLETTTTKTLNLGATNLAKLTDEEKAIATEKNWTLS